MLGRSADCVNEPTRDGAALPGKVDDPLDELPQAHPAKTSDGTGCERHGQKRRRNAHRLILHRLLNVGHK